MTSAFFESSLPYPSAGLGGVGGDFPKSWFAALVAGGENHTFADFFTHFTRREVGNVDEFFTFEISGGVPFAKAGKNGFCADGFAEGDGLFNEFITPVWFGGRDNEADEHFDFIEVFDSDSRSSGFGDGHKNSFLN